MNQRVSPGHEDRVLVLAPTTADAALTQSLLTEAGLACRICPDLAGLCREFAQGAGALLLTEEVLAVEGTEGLVEALRGQPPWSDVPILLLSRSGADSPRAAWAMDLFGNVTVLERPTRVTTLVSGLRAALRARRRQYELCAKVEAIKALNERLAADVEGMTRMQEISTHMVRAGDVAALLDEILDAALGITGTDKGNIQLVAGDNLKIVSQRGFDAPFLEFFDEVEKGHGAACGSAMQSRERVIVEDVERSPVFAGRPSRAIVLAADVRAVQSTPLVSRSGRLLGMFSTHYRVPHRPTERELRLLDLLARQAADLIESKQAADALHHSEELHRKLFEADIIGIMTVMPDGRIIDANEAFLNLVGYDRADLEAGRLDWKRLTPPEVLAAAAETRRAHPPINGWAPPSEQEFLRQDGSRVPVLLGGACITDDGAAEGVCFVLDITERKRAERALQESELHLRLAIDAGAIGVWRWYPDSREAWMDARTAEMFGLDPIRFDGTTAAIGRLIHPDDRAALREVAFNAARDCGGYAADIRIVRPDGLRWMSVRALPTLDATGQIAYFTGVSTDVTARKLSEELLRESEARERERATLLQTILDTSPTPIWIALDPACETIVGNPAANALLGAPAGANVSLDAARGTSYAYRSLREGVEVPAEMLPMQRAARDGVDVGAEEYQVIRGDGSVVWIYLHAAPLMEAGRPRGAIAVAVDITERKRAEEQLREADRRKDEFLATLAHELRNPLAPLRNGLRIMKLAAGDAEAIEQARSMMERQISQMAHLIDDLMDLSRISRGKIELQKTRLRLAEVLQDAVDTARPLLEERGHQFVYDVPPEPIFVEADRTRLAQVFGNLLNNAAKYTEAAGRIRLAVETRGGEVVVTVEDNGVGIPSHMLPKVFDIFTQVDRSLEKAQGGLGIGLSIVRRLVEMHGGAIEAQSGGHGKGSRFVVRLPVAPGDQTDKPTRESPAAAAVPRRRVLVVDDNRDAAVSLAVMLRFMGNDTRTAHDGLEALDVGAKFEPDVVLLDIGMPKLNGFDACRRFRAQAWARNTVIIACTGWGQPSDKRKSLEAGFDFHVTKPVDPVALEKMLARSPARVWENSEAHAGVEGAPGRSH